MSATAETHLLHRDLRNDPIEIVGGDGVWVRATDGSAYLDGVGGAAVVSIGHGVREVFEVLSREHPTYVYGEGFSSPAAERFATDLVDFVGAPFSTAYLVSGGSEANETAIKLARQFHLERGEPSRHKIIARWQSYHGVTTGMLSLSGRTSWREPFDPYLFSVPRIPAPYCFRCPFSLTYPSCATFCATELERTILREGPGTVAAFIAEPIIGTTVTGVTPVADYYGIVREICDKYGVLFIADEVLTGMGRTGRPLALHHWDVDADIVTLGKGLGSGYAALGAVLSTERVVEPLRTGSGRFNHGFTYAGLPASAAVGDKVLEIMRRDQLVTRCHKSGELLRERLATATVDIASVGDIRGRGLLVGVEIVRDQSTLTPYPAEYEFARRVAARCLAQHRVVVRPGISGANHGMGGDHLQISPPFVITDDEIDVLVEAVAESVRHVANEFAAA